MAGWKMTCLLKITEEGHAPQSIMVYADHISIDRNGRVEIEGHVADGRKSDAMDADRIPAALAKTMQKALRGESKKPSADAEGFHNP